MEKFTIIIIVSAILLTMPLFWLGFLMTPRPGSSSGNGNPAIFIMFLLIPLFAISVYGWVQLLRAVYIKQSYLYWTMLLIIVHIIVAFIYQVNSFNKYRLVWEEAYKKDFGLIDYEYINGIMTVASIHMNSQFFNANTFMMFITFSIFIGCLIELLRRKMRLRNE
ncbi:hypothetical protein [Cytobacillus purgationiresistens]|uniref:Uncharacterized protein n=1 Tax=Cytobacillus purgationiresistens TaxID=863449 RepID=A0ABU0AML0_9BACI|nr:hypothetical protein [Cytobacillus purgationiresistens]MDQ0271623.1 hypothetical protein [Cytobacillus purgationiresistens]